MIPKASSTVGKSCDVFTRAAEYQCNICLCVNVPVWQAQLSTQLIPNANQSLKRIVSYYKSLV